jgi:hypothetical protein
MVKFTYNIIFIQGKKMLDSLRFKFVLMCLLTLSLQALGSGEKTSLKVGIADSDITPGKGVPLGGYGGAGRRQLPWRSTKHNKYFKPNQGKLDPIRAKSMVLEKNGNKLLFVSLDLVGTIAHLKSDLIKRIGKYGFNKDNVFISSNHTHSGPGAVTYNRLWSFIAMDKFSRSIYNKMMGQVQETVENSLERLAPAELFSTSFKASNLQRNRRGKPGHFDDNAKLLLAKSKSNGTWLGGMINFAIHGTALGLKNLKFSADVPGAIERNLETYLQGLNANNHRPSFLFVNGAQGDVSPSAGGVTGMTKIGESFTEQAKSSLNNLTKVDDNWSVAKSRIYLGRPYISINACSKDKGVMKWLKKLRLFRLLRFALKWWIPSKVDLYAIKLGEITFMTWPGEATTSLGIELNELAMKNGSENNWILGLTNNHLGYFVTPEEYKVSTTESCSSFYGKNGGRKIIKKYGEILNDIQ